MGACLACGAVFPVDNVEQRPRAAVFSPAIDPWVALAGCGLVLGLALAVLAHFQVLGGVLLIVIGFGLVVAVGAYEAGYLDGAVKSLRAGLGGRGPGGRSGGPPSQSE